MSSTQDPLKTWLDQFESKPVQSYQDIEKELPVTPGLDLGDILEARKKQLGGYTSEEAAAMRSQMASQMARQGQSAQRQLLAAQAKAGVRGGAAASQGQRLLQNIAQQRAAGEQDLFIKNIAEQQRRQASYEDLVKAQRFANLSAQLTRQQMAQAERESQRQQEAAKLTAIASSEKLQEALKNRNKPQRSFGQEVAGVAGDILFAPFGKGWLW